MPGRTFCSPVSFTCTALNTPLPPGCHDPAPHVSPAHDLTHRTPLDVLLYFLPQLPGLLNGKN